MCIFYIMSNKAFLWRILSVLSGEKRDLAKYMRVSEMNSLSLYTLSKYPTRQFCGGAGCVKAF